MALGDKLNDLAGKAKEAAGKATDNDRLKAEGQGDQAQAKVSDTVNDVKDHAAGLKDSFDK